MRSLERLLRLMQGLLSENHCCHPNSDYTSRALEGLSRVQMCRPPAGPNRPTASRREAESLRWFKFL